MPTYLDLRNRIARDLWRAPTATACDYDQDIKDAVASAVRAWQAEPFWWNEVDWQADGGTTAGEPYYPVPDDAAAIRNVKLQRGNDWLPLEAISEEAADMANGSGVPDSFCVVNRQVRLVPTPNGSYKLNLTGTRLVDPPVDDADETPWSNEAHDLILHWAEGLLWTMFKGDERRGRLSFELAETARAMLRRRTSRFVRAATIVPSGYFS